MRVTARVVAGAVLLAAVVCGPAQAQGAKISLGGGLTLPLGGLNDAAQAGFHGLAAVSFQPAGFPVGIQVDGMFNRMGAEDDPVQGDVDVAFQVIQGTVNAVYRFSGAEGARLRPYLIGGVGLYLQKLTGEDVPEGFFSETDFGLNGGGGLDFSAGSLAVFVESRFHTILNGDDATHLLPVTVGIRLGGN